MLYKHNNYIRQMCCSWGSWGLQMAPSGRLTIQPGSRPQNTCRGSCSAFHFNQICLTVCLTASNPAPTTSVAKLHQTRPQLLQFKICFEPGPNKFSFKSASIPVPTPSVSNRLQTLPLQIRLQNYFKHPVSTNVCCKTASTLPQQLRMQNCFKPCPNNFGWKTASNTQCQKPSFAKLLQTLSQQLWLQNFFKHCPNNIEPEPEWSGKPEIRRKSGAWAEIEYCNTGDATLIRTLPI